ncbi:AAA family ATPase [Candidatus Woesearchaeota archaeon]|nr:AAA family ATPase [Candidatus Woesearchaeota archaeon]
MEKRLNDFFESYLKKDPLFTDKKTLQSSYTPEKIIHREKQIQEIAQILAPSLRQEKPSNLFIYGKTGTGKTCVVKYVTQQMEDVAKRNDLQLKIIYLNCKSQKVADTEYRVIAQLIRELGEEIPTTGLPTKDVYDFFIKLLEERKILLILILDEIDHLVKKIEDGILYTLTRMNVELKTSEVSIIGISNDLQFTSYLDARVKSSLAEEEITFPPYDAVQLKKILEERSRISFKNGVLEEGLIEKCAAYAAREHGDARRALELLRVAGELAEREGKNKVTMEHLDLAQEKIDKDRMLEAVRINPKHFQITLHSILHLKQNTNNSTGIFTGDVYEVYKESSRKCGLPPLTQRRVSDIIAEMDMLGMIQTKVISKGRYGRSREIRVDLPQPTIEEMNQILKQGLNV